RLVIPRQAHHIVQFGVDRQTIFRTPDDYPVFLTWLREAAKQYKVAIHAYVLMPNHLHILATPSDAEGLARMMQWAGRHYVPYFNRKYGRSGTLWQGRFKATVIDAASYLLTCSRYIELNPVRAGLVAHPADYPWSSYIHHIGAKPDSLITEHALYWALGNTPFERDIAYRQLSEQALTPKELQDLKDTANKGWVLGSETFKTILEAQLNRQVRPGKRGRPAKRLVEEVVTDVSVFDN
ncbi:MAG TPA: transposase, partial [Burkholderiaceae bacterium]|nr:transposase [Burkholderiaceae bacterium]